MFRKAYYPNEEHKGSPKTYSPSPEGYKKWVDPVHVDRDGKTALHHLILQGGDDDQQLGQLIKAGCDVRATDKDGQTGLHFASERGATRCISRLVKHGADPNDISRYGYSPLMLAARHNFPKAVRALIRAGANPSLENDKLEAALHYAVCKGHLECVEDLLANKAMVNRPNMEGASPLILATKCGQREAVRSLITAGANLDQADTIGRTALHWASSLGDTEITEMLIDAGAEVDCFDSHGQSPFVYTIQTNNPAVMRQLLAAKCDRSTVDGLNGTALGLASIRGHDECVRILLETGDGPDECGYFGLTPLMFTVFESHHSVVETLLSFGANPNARGRQCIAPIFKCLVNVCSSNADKRHQILATLIRAGADVNVCANTASYFTSITNGKNCPLSFAICSGYVSLMRMLLLAGSQVSREELQQWSTPSGTDTYNRHSLMSPIRECLYQPKALKHLCRTTIRAAIPVVNKDMRHEIETLPIAPVLKDFVNFFDFNHIEPQKADMLGLSSQSMMTMQPINLCPNLLRSLQGTFLFQQATRNDI